MKHIGLFEGIGGFSLAARWVGWKTVAWCEINDFSQKVLKYHFPDAEGFGDITKTDFTKYANSIDIVTGGFPCQPFSAAGKRKGTEDERYLWKEMLRAVGEIQPAWVVGENVLGIVNWNRGMVFNEVQTDLETKGYEVFPYVLPACAKDAPHRRDRVWFVAYNTNNRRFNRDGKEQEIQDGEQSSNTIGTINNVTNTESGRLQKWDAKQLGKSKQNKNDKQLHSIPSWENFPTQSPVYRRDDGLSFGLDTITISIAKWRTESIKAYGNAIVPQVAYEIFKAINHLKI